MEPEENAFTRYVGGNPYGANYGYRGAEAPAAQKRTYIAGGSVTSARTAIPTAPRRTTTNNDITIGRTSAPRNGGGAKAVFSAGDRVRHATFGEGYVLSVKPMGADTLYEIEFERVGTKKLMATYARLTKV